MRRNKNYIFKESFDNLPLGITIFNSEGIVNLKNYKIQNIYHRLTNKDDYYTIHELKEALTKESPNAIIIDNHIYFENEAYEINERMITDEIGLKYTLISAVDITTLNNKKEELSILNKELETMNLKLTELSKNLQSIIVEEETLTLKIKVHDETGKSIIEAKSLYNSDASIEEINAFASKAKESFVYLNYVNKENTISLLSEYANKLGLNLCLPDIPFDLIENKEFTDLLSEAITNTYKHSGGKNVEINVALKDNIYNISIENDGTVPTSISYSGGLLHLKNRLEKSGNTLNVELNDKFRLIATIRKGE